MSSHKPSRSEDICEEIIMEDKDYKIKELSEEIENLKRTIRCYEKLIERLY